MEQMVLQVEYRNTTRAGELRKLRDAGKIPAVLYGDEREPLLLSVPVKFFQSQHALGQSLVDLHLEDKTFHAMVHDYQRHPVSRKLLHVDFHEVDLQKKIDVKLMVHLVGQEDVEKRHGIVQQQIREIEVRTLPTSVPEMVTVDISGLDIGAHLSARDVVLPDGAQLRSDADEVVVTILAPKHVEAAETETAD